MTYFYRLINLPPIISSQSANLTEGGRRNVEANTFSLKVNVWGGMSFGGLNVDRNECKFKFYSGFLEDYLLPSAEELRNMFCDSAIVHIIENQFFESQLY